MVTLLINVNFPDSLLDLGGKFNHSLANLKIINKIEYLKFGYYYNQPFDNITFEKLNIVCISNNFTLNILEHCPTLIYLMFNPCMSKPLNEIKLPDTIQYIKYSFSSTSIFTLLNVNYPKDLKTLILPGEISRIINEEQSVIETIGNYFWQLNNLPDTLEELHVPYVDKKNINLPSSLQ